MPSIFDPPPGVLPVLLHNTVFRIVRRLQQVRLPRFTHPTFYLDRKMHARLCGSPILSIQDQCRYPHGYRPLAITRRRLPSVPAWMLSGLSSPSKRCDYPASLNLSIIPKTGKILLNSCHYLLCQSKS